MRDRASRLAAIVALLLLLVAPFGGQSANAAPAYRLWMVGNEADVQTNPRGGIALMGGGPDVDEAFRWLLGQSQGGDVVVIRTSGGDGYNAYIAGLDGVQTPADSVATLLIHERSAASDEVVLEMIRDAEMFFIAGGDQADYLRLWQDTPLQAVIADQVADGMTIGGTSAGAVILGEHIYSAARGSVTSRTALRHPFDRRVTLTSGFLDLRGLEGVIVDSHFSERNRKGRLVAFLARIAKQAGVPVRGIGLDEGTAALIDGDGAVSIAGDGAAYVLEASGPPQRCTPKKPLTFRALAGFRAEAGEAFDVTTWSGAGLDPVQASAVRGRLRFQVGSSRGRG